MFFFQKWSFWLGFSGTFRGRFLGNISGRIASFLLGNWKESVLVGTEKIIVIFQWDFQLKPLASQDFLQTIPKKLVDCYRISASTMSRKTRKTPQGVWSTLSRPRRRLHPLRGPKSVDPQNSKGWSRVVCAWYANPMTDPWDWYIHRHE